MLYDDLIIKLQIFKKKKKKKKRLLFSLFLNFKFNLKHRVFNLKHRASIEFRKHRGGLILVSKLGSEEMEFKNEREKYV